MTPDPNDTEQTCTVIYDPSSKQFLTHQYTIPIEWKSQVGRKVYNYENTYTIKRVTKLRCICGKEIEL